MRSPPLQRAARRLALAGYAVEILRRRRGPSGQRYTPFAAFDLLALAEGKRPLGVLLASQGEDVLRLEKLLPQLPAVRAWLAGGNEFQIYCSHNRGPGRRRRWLKVTLGKSG
jgi:hypothetical protein